METCTYGLGAGMEKPTAERRKGALCRAYNSVVMPVWVIRMNTTVNF